MFCEISFVRGLFIKIPGPLNPAAYWKVHIFFQDFKLLYFRYVGLLFTVLFSIATLGDQSGYEAEHKWWLFVNELGNIFLQRGTPLLLWGGGVSTHRTPSLRPWCIGVCVWGTRYVLWPSIKTFNTSHARVLCTLMSKSVTRRCFRPSYDTKWPYPCVENNSKETSHWLPLLPRDKQHVILHLGRV